jgi:DNA polymerase elongation subunit (family B)
MSEELIENLDGLTKEELELKLSEYENMANRYFNYEQSIKRILNSIYGAFGNEHFYFFNINIAESITLQGQHAILYTESMLNKYFTDFWHKDKQTHEKLGINVKGQVYKPVVIYIDTDSCYVAFEEVLNKCDWQGSEKDFILQLYEIRLKEYLEKVLGKYADSYGTENFLSFEMESVAKSAVWIAKKKYIQDIVWTDPNIHFDSLTKIKTKGWETVQASTPTASRKILQGALTIIFTTDRVEIDEIVTYLKEKKKSFKLENIEDICENLRMNYYEKYVLDDVNRMELAKGCGPNVKGAAFHNYLLNNSKNKNKYKLLTSGERLKLYYTTDKRSETFAYSSGEYPYEFAPEIDYETQFEKTVIDPLNRVLASIGLQTLNRNLIYAKSLF